MSDLAIQLRYQEARQSLPWYVRAILAISPRARRELFGTVTSRVADDPGWNRLNQAPLDLSWDEFLTMQEDALEAWRKNPLARRIVSLNAAYIVGEGITVSSDYDKLDAFIRKWWTHPDNNIDLRLPEWASELCRAGELFPVLNRAADGMTYIRMVPACEIDGIRWRDGDYESETEFHRIDNVAADLEALGTPVGSARSTKNWWKGPAHPDAAAADQLMLHYTVNKPVGCTRGESDLSPILPWLKHYSRWLEDRVRINWAARVWLWFVKVPANKVEAKKLQYAVPPQPGSIIVHDDGEEWEMKTPDIKAGDVSADGKAMRYMIASGAGIPLHMLSEAEGTNLATANAQMDTAARHYRARQQFFAFMLGDIVLRSYEWYRMNLHPSRRPRKATFADLKISLPELVRNDNATLASAALSIVNMFASLRQQLVATGVMPNDELNKRTIDMAFRFAGEFLTQEEIARLLETPLPGGSPIINANTEPDQQDTPTEPAPTPESEEPV